MGGRLRRSRGGVPGADARAALGLIARAAAPGAEDRRYGASTKANCFFCRLPDALLALPAGRAVVPDGARATVTDASDDTRRRSSSSWAAEPTAEQWRAISWPFEPYVLVAGAGSGKTSVMAARVDLPGARRDREAGPPITPGVLPGNVLCLTFTNKATENLQRSHPRTRCGPPARGGRGARDPELPRLRGAAARAPRDARGLRAGRAAPQPARNARSCARGCWTG